MNAKPINWPTKPGWYIVENIGFVDNDPSKEGPIHRVVCVYEKKENGSWGRQFLHKGFYVHEGDDWESIESYFTSYRGIPWEGLRFIPIDLPLLVSAYDAAHE